MSLRDLGVFNPLPDDHPLVKKKERCWVCNTEFSAGVRTALMPLEGRGEKVKTVAAKAVCATCFLRGGEIETPEGLKIVDTIKNGDASPYPVITTDKKQWKDEEVRQL